LKAQPKSRHRAPGGFEIGAETINIVGLAETFPISKDKSEEFIRDMRHLWLRSRKMNLVMKVRAEVLEAAREYFKNKATPKFPRPCSYPQLWKAAQLFCAQILRSRTLLNTEQPTLP
jgi:aspartyl/asparaginyl-tRNA synthetase